jgi:integrase/recombinase XerD
MAGPRLTDAIPLFLEALRVDRGASAKTLQAYGADLRQFAEGLPSPTITVSDVAREHIEKHVGVLASAKASSVARKLSALRQFFKFCCRELGLEQNPSERIASPRQGARLPKALNAAQIGKLLAAADTGLPYEGERADALRARDRAMIYLLYATGLRATELASLSLHEIDLEQGYCRVKGKGSKERIAPFADAAGEPLRAYLKLRPQLGPKSDAVFLHHAAGGRNTGRALSRQDLWLTIKRLAASAGIPEKSVSPHVLRHSFATHLMQSGMNLRSLQTLLGHADLATTQIYAHVSPEHLKATHRKFHPRGGG